MGRQQAINPPSVPPGDRPYSLSIRFGDTLYTAGLVGMDLATGKSVGDDFGKQVRQAMDNLKLVLESAGSSLDRVLTVTCYITDIERWAEMNAIYFEYFPSDKRPARATVQVGLVPPYQFEIQAVAYVGD